MMGPLERQTNKERGTHLKTEYLQSDIDRGRQWYIKHKHHVLRIVKEERHEYPMSESDISHPELWKPAAWRWFLKQYGEPS
jgi:hypothetical protein